MKAKQIGHLRLKTARQGHGKGGAACPLRVLNVLERWHRGLGSLVKEWRRTSGICLRAHLLQLLDLKRKGRNWAWQKLTLFSVRTAKFRAEPIFGSQTLPKYIWSNSLCWQGPSSPSSPSSPRFGGSKLPSTSSLFSLLYLAPPQKPFTLEELWSGHFCLLSLKASHNPPLVCRT